VSSFNLDALESPDALRALPEDAMPAVCDALREEIISVCGRVGGHLGASLGAVELIVALHRVFRSPKDAIVFDVGHQAYAHKFLTGRRERMATLRQASGLAPFLDPAESPHDAFAAGHACTAVSSALGLLEARVERGTPGSVVAVVGDGALTGGLTFEALNNAGARTLPLIVVVNDNQMSISPNVGAISQLLPTGRARHFFEALGFTYLGPVEGHSLGELTTALREAKRSLGPVVVHVKTEKGRGFRFAEEDAQTRGHAMGPYELRAGKLVRSRGGQQTFSEAFASALLKAMEADPRVVAVTPAMVEGSALMEVRKRFPHRLHDVGIAEQHALTFSAGLAAGGARPVCCFYSTFLQRGIDQLLHDICLPNLPVVIAIDRAGLVGADGATHQGAYDLSLLRTFPNLTVSAAVAGDDLEPLLATALSAPGPFALRFPRATVPDLRLDAQAPVRGARWLKSVANPRVVIATLGPLAVEALDAARDEPTWAVLDVRFVTPLDVATLDSVDAPFWVTVEEGVLAGGMGSALLEHFAARGKVPRLKMLGLPSTPVPHGDARVQRRALGLSVEGIREAVRALGA
jgi:1-deoxy-D-xylulose-5-phosphate synthase